MVPLSMNKFHQDLIDECGLSSHVNDSIKASIAFSLYMISPEISSFKSLFLARVNVMKAVFGEGFVFL
jgi:hypothetical protein